MERPLVRVHRAEDFFPAELLALRLVRYLPDDADQVGPQRALNGGRAVGGVARIPEVLREAVLARI